MKLSKTSIIAAACLGAVALTGVGFAGWYIVAEATQNETGNITVYDITTDAVVISDRKWDDQDIADSSTAGNIIFGSPKTADLSSKGDNTWFRYSSEGDGAVAEEAFPSKYTFTLTDYSKKSNAPTVNASIIFDDTPTNEQLNAYSKCLTDKYITGFDLVDTTTTDSPKAKAHTFVKDTELKIEEGKKETNYTEYTVTITFNFGWGEAFKDSTTYTNLNPYIYYSKQVGGNDIYNKALTAMKTIYGLQGLKYKMTISAQAGN